MDAVIKWVVAAIFWTGKNGADFVSTAECIYSTPNLVVVMNNSRCGCLHGVHGCNVGHVWLVLQQLVGEGGEKGLP